MKDAYFFNSLNLNLKLDEFNAKKIFNIFIKAKEIIKRNN